MMVDIIGEVLDLEPLESDIKEAKALVKTVKSKLDSAEIGEDTLDRDFAYAKGNLYQVIEHGGNALDELLQVATASQNARAFEVVATLVSTLTAANIALMDLTKKNNDIKRADSKPGSNPHTVNNNLFVGSTNELAKMVKEAKIVEAAKVPVKND